MINIYEPQKARIVLARKESPDTVFLRLVFADRGRQKGFDFLPGQFMQIGLPGWGECPISLCSSSADRRRYFELTIRDVGSLTHKISVLGRGDAVWVRGPFGNGFDTDKIVGRPTVLIGGGCGFAPLRPLILDFINGRLKVKSLQIFYGCLNEDTILFKKELTAWNRRSELSVILDRPSKQWAGEKGLVTDLFKIRPVKKGSVAIAVGPPAMYRFAIKRLLAAGVRAEDIYVSLERKMYCGVGVCQHCAIGPYYVCLDGPVFSYAQIRNIDGVI